MKNVNLTDGPIFKTLFFYSLPIIITNVVQILFHAADIAVLSIMADDAAVAAVGACGAIINFLISLFAGLATGANVLVAKKVGARDDTGVKRATGTSLLIAFIAGAILAVIGVIFAEDFLILTNCQPDVLEMATTYMTIYSLGMPINMLYNFSASVLRATGDSAHPMSYIMISGVLNVGLNVIFVGLCNMTVSGVALATVLSTLFAELLALGTIFKNGSQTKPSKNDLRIGKYEFLEIMKVGVPTCLCSAFYYVAGVVISSSVNSLSTDAMTANAISSQFDSIIYTVGCAIATATAAMVGQNLGAGKLDRIRRTMKTSILYVTGVSLALGSLFVVFAEPILDIMTDSANVIAIAKDRMIFLCLTYFTTSIMEVFSFSLRSLGRANVTMYVGLVCGFAIRVTWSTKIWPLLGSSLSLLYACIPIGAVLAAAIYLFVYLSTIKKLKSTIIPAI